MSDGAAEPTEPTEPDDEDRSADEEADDDTSPEAEQVRRQDPDAPALGAVDDGDQVTDPPEPHEPA